MNIFKIGTTFLVCLLMAGETSLNAQTINEIKADRQTYIWGEGVGETLKSADQTALAEIIGQISVQVENTFTQKSVEKGKDFSQSVNDIIKTYSSATLKNTERIVLQNEPEAKVFRYVKRSEVQKIFESRKLKIIEFARSGESAQKNLQLADALRYYYWAQTLLRSHPESNDIRMTDANGKEVLLIVWLPKQLNEIFANLSFEVGKIEDNENYLCYLLNIKYKKQPVLNLDYTYWGGQDWSNIVSAKDGRGIVELPKTQMGADIRLKIEYVFEGESNIDLELRDVMQKVPQVMYKNSFISFSSKEKEKEPEPVETQAAEPKPADSTAVQGNLTVASSNNPVATNSLAAANADFKMDVSVPLGSIQALTNTGEQEAVMAKIRKAILQKKYDVVEPLFTPEGYDIYKKLLQYGKAKIVKNEPMKYYSFGDFILCRSLTMSFSFESNDRTFIEDVVFYLDKNNKVCNLTFGLASDAINDIASHTTWTEATRMLIMSFLENYKTAYALKRYDYIGSIFSDEALIITGHVVKPNSSPETTYLNNDIIRYNRQTKSEYMKMLKYCFDSNEFINIRFTSNNVRRSGKGNEIYGIQIKQEYFSTNYGDMGYLFLLVDLSDTIKPLIHVRTWQPEKNADGSIYGLSDF
jgi:hypothetical protein